MFDITFIIPTIGRTTLINSIKSLINQTNKNWKAIIIFDGIKSNIDNIDNRIKIVEIEKMGINQNSAGNVRNYGMSLVETEWIGFLDDDDIISDDYVDIFNKELNINNYNNIDLDLIIFRMKMGNRIIPKLKTDNFYICDVGISFVMKKKIYDNGTKFIPDGAEDYLYLNNIRKKGYKIMISPHIKYFVRINNLDSEKETIIGNRIYINTNNSFVLFNCYLNYLKNFDPVKLEVEELEVEKVVL
jgi:glycosyltransferase involved in cell wall biosynthesis